MSSSGAPLLLLLLLLLSFSFPLILLLKKTSGNERTDASWGGPRRPGVKGGGWSDAIAGGQPPRDGPPPHVQAPKKDLLHLPLAPRPRAFCLSSCVLPRDRVAASSRSLVQPALQGHERRNELLHPLVLDVSHQPHHLCAMAFSAGQRASNGIWWLSKW